MQEILYSPFVFLCQNHPKPKTPTCLDRWWPPRVMRTTFCSKAGGFPLVSSRLMGSLPAGGGGGIGIDIWTMGKPPDSVPVDTTFVDSPNSNRWSIFVWYLFVVQFHDLEWWIQLRMVSNGLSLWSRGASMHYTSGFTPKFGIPLTVGSQSHPTLGDSNRHFQSFAQNSETSRGAASPFLTGWWIDRRPPFNNREMILDNSPGHAVFCTRTILVLTALLI